MYHQLNTTNGETTTLYQGGWEHGDQVVPIFKASIAKGVAWNWGWKVVGVMEATKEHVAGHKMVREVVRWKEAAFLGLLKLWDSWIIGLGLWRLLGCHSWHACSTLGGNQGQHWAIGERWSSYHFLIKGTGGCFTRVSGKENLANCQTSSEGGKMYSRFFSRCGPAFHSKNSMWAFAYPVYRTCPVGLVRLWPSVLTWAVLEV